MKLGTISGILGAAAISATLFSTHASAAGFIHKNIQCPKQNVQIIPVGDPIELEDIILSSGANTNVDIFFNPGPIKIMTAYLTGRQPMVVNFQGQVESGEDQGLRVSCTNNVKLSVTVVGNTIF